MGAIGEIFGVYRQALTEGDQADGLAQSAVSDLLEVLRTGEAVDLIRESVRTVLQELIEAESAQGFVLPADPQPRRRIDQALYAVVMEA